MKYFYVKLMIVLLFLSNNIFAQDMEGSTKLSQYASTTQRIGTTDITIEYHSPLVQGRKIFGYVVPFDFVVDGQEYPWRAGANKNTKITFTHDVTIEGKFLLAGTYGLHVFVAVDEWIFIFSNNPKNWGSFQYNNEEDALRVKVPTIKTDFQEWLSYRFMNPKTESCEMVLQWEETKAILKIETDVTSNIIADLKQKEDKKAVDYLYLARRIYQQDPNLIQEALAVIDTSLSKEKFFQNQMYQAELFIRSGEVKKGKALKKEILASAKGFDIYYYGLSFYLLEGKKKEAFQILKKYLQQKPKDWVAHLALGEYYIKEGKEKKVIEHFELSYQYAPDNWKNYARYLFYANRQLVSKQ